MMQIPGGSEFVSPQTVASYTFLEKTAS